ncbi:MAG: ATP-binding protein, partial [Thermoplasmata archaeon]|nr:ATP-binding protein [Thermoplasmata archaeon]
YPEDAPALRVDKGQDYTSSFVYSVGKDAIDPLEVERLRSWMRKANPENELSRLGNDKLLEAMNLVRSGEDGVVRPTLACVLLLGKEEILRDNLPQCEAVFLRFDEDDTTPVQSKYLKEPLMKVIDKVWSLIEPYNKTVVIKDAFFETPVPSFPEEVVREGLLNALTHRDYTRNEPIQIKLFKDRLEISNPGGFVGDVTPENILTHPPARRNPSLSEAFQHIGVVNKAGLGVDRMYKKLISFGKTPPEYPSFKDAVTLIIRDGDFDETLAKFVGRRAKDGYGWKLDELIVIHHLRRNDKIKAEEASMICQKTLKDSSELLSSMDGRFLERYGSGRGTYYQYTKEIMSTLGEKAKYTRMTKLSEDRMIELIKRHLETYGRVTNNEIQDICGIDRNQAYRLILKLVEQKVIVRRGERRGAYYEKRA